MVLGITTPYCRSRCDFCLYYKKTAHTGDLETYTKRMIRLVGYFSDLFKEVKFSRVYFDGGTPTLFSEKQLNKLLAAIFGNFHFEENCLRDVETHPNSVTRGKLEILRKWGFNRISLGVQDMSAEILSLSGRRHQTRDMVKNAITWSRQLGFPEISVDMLLGLFGNDENRFIKSFEDVAALCPDTIILYIMEPSAFYLKRRFKNRRDIFEVHLNSQLLWLDRVKARAQQLDYAIAPESLARISDGIKFHRVDGICAGKCDYSYQDLNTVETVFNVGAGWHASKLFNRFQYETVSLKDDPARNVYIGRISSEKDRYRHYLLERFEKGESVAKREFYSWFGVRLEDAFADGLSSLKALKLIKETENSFRLLPAIGSVERFAAAMFMLEYRRLASVVNNMIRGKELAIGVNGKERRLIVSYDETGQNVFAMEFQDETEEAGQLERKLIKGAEKVFDKLSRSIDTCDLVKFTRRFESSLRAFLNKAGHKLEGRTLTVRRTGKR